MVLTCNACVFSALQANGVKLGPQYQLHIPSQNKAAVENTREKPGNDCILQAHLKEFLLINACMCGALAILLWYYTCATWGHIHTYVSMSAK